MHEINLLDHPLERVLDLACGPCQRLLLAKHPDVDDVISGRTPVIIYPAARMGRFAAKKLRERGIEVVAFGDSNPATRGACVSGIPVLAPDEIQALHPNVPVLIASTAFDSEIADSLTKKGLSRVVPVGILNLVLPDVFVSREYSGCVEAVSNRANHAKIRRIYDMLGDEESRRVFVSKLLFYVTLEKSILDGICSRYPIYFEETVHSISPAEVMVDGGAFTGDTLQDFLTVSKGKFESYYAFEPDPTNFSKLRSLPSVDGVRVVAVEAGLGRQASQRRFQPTGSEAAKFLSDEETGEAVVGVVSLDEFFCGRRVPTFVKMDIEGGERDALNGAAEIISRHQPKLAISVYHHPRDLWEVPDLMQTLNPDYKLFFRHHTREIADTVCYAMPRGSGIRSSGNS